MSAIPEQAPQDGHPAQSPEQAPDIIEAGGDASDDEFQPSEWDASSSGDSPSKIIDLGTGTGIWAMEVGGHYPSAEVTGVDLSPIQPRWVPSNVRFFVDDVEDDWLAEAYVGTQVFGANVKSDARTMPDNWPLLESWSKIRDVMHKMKIDIQIAPRIGAILKDAGFVNVQVRSYKVPVGTWPLGKIKRLVGHCMRSVTEEFLGAAASKPLAALGMERTEIEVFLASVRNAIKDLNVHAYGTYYSRVGQKPVELGSK
ncbi:methyltransferase [Colletotrichum costaricense]|uniref:Methyltransferase n=1 Tax=Colletotrichum costaricense TaxID=1209916 RepID=A0AAI9ZAQ6_9PEZI|nr:methyltransferase [Colletotrichum costaricense]KAK1539141.1 methyltransferase [Colletotrichum costaricense]